MEDSLLQSQMELLSGLLSIPIAIFYDADCLKAFAPYSVSFDMVLPWIHLLTCHDGQPQIIMAGGLLLVGKVVDEATGCGIFLGPVRSGKIDEKDVRRIIASGSPALQNADLHEITVYLNASESFSVSRFTAVLNLIYSFRNHKEASVCSDASLREVHNALHRDGDITDYTSNLDADYERKILFYVQHGMTDALKKMGNYMGDVPELASAPLRMYQNAVIILNSLCQRAAIAGGLEPEISHRIGLAYIRKIEACASVAELIKINQNMQMAVDYSERVAEIVCPNSADPNIQKAIRYIRRNFQKKMTVREIAGIVHLSKEYLSSRFHAETGMTIPSYIAQQKIVAAQELLSFTGMTIAEIASFLSFSSQSYFQSVFKRIVGKTPMSYRQKAG